MLLLKVWFGFSRILETRIFGKHVICNILKYDIYLQIFGIFANTTLESLVYPAEYIDILLSTLLSVFKFWISSDCILYFPFCSGEALEEESDLEEEEEEDDDDEITEESDDNESSPKDFKNIQAAAPECKQQWTPAVSLIYCPVGLKRFLITTPFGALGIFSWKWNYPHSVRRFEIT